MAHVRKKKNTTAEESTSPEYVSPVPAAEVLSKSRSWIDKKARDGEIPYYRTSKRSVLFKVSDLHAYMEKFRVDPNEPAAHETRKRTRNVDGKFARTTAGKREGSAK